MDKKFIDAEMLIAELEASCMPINEKRISGNLGDNESIADVIRAQPAADVQDVRHGKWIYEEQTINTPLQLNCSICGWWSLDPSIDGTYHYFSHCGAKMDGDEK